AHAVACCSLCAAVATVVNAIAAPSAGRQLGSNSGGPPTAGISEPRGGDKLTAFASDPIGKDGVGAPRDGSRSRIDHLAEHHQTLRPGALSVAASAIGSIHSAHWAGGAEQA